MGKLAQAAMIGQGLISILGRNAYSLVRDVLKAQRDMMAIEAIAKTLDITPYLVSGWTSDELARYCMRYGKLPEQSEVHWWRLD